ncbi:hypothetical protein MJO28_003381 [Puccinia striiformis f. sp. tritici]|uniref:Uncharacterized protein n=1 Tax=Puccinia striiformis f. sp. tritici TaxID=168172 RepID=A0ACC0ESJ9_9BASI|nr:hypothetical protein MJO28_003381 [Puccinia striiformis f. sp. tritici]
MLSPLAAFSHQLIRLLRRAHSLPAPRQPNTQGQGQQENSYHLSQFPSRSLPFHAKTDLNPSFHALRLPGLGKALRENTMEGSTQADASKIYRMLLLHKLASETRIYRRLLLKEAKKDLPFNTQAKMIALNDLVEKQFAPQTSIHHPRIWNLRRQGGDHVLQNLGTPPVPQPDAKGLLRQPSIRLRLEVQISSSCFTTLLKCALLCSIILQIILYLC